MATYRYFFRKFPLDGSSENSIPARQNQVGNENAKIVLLF